MLRRYFFAGTSGTNSLNISHVSGCFPLRCEAVADQSTATTADPDADNNRRKSQEVWLPHSWATVPKRFPFDQTAPRKRTPFVDCQLQWVKTVSEGIWIRI